MLRPRTCSEVFPRRCRKFFRSTLFEVLLLVVVVAVVFTNPPRVVPSESVFKSSGKREERTRYILHSIVVPGCILVALPTHWNGVEMGESVAVVAWFAFFVVGGRLRVYTIIVRSNEPTNQHHHHLPLLLFILIENCAN